MVEQSDGLAAVTESTKHDPWTVLSALTTEFADSIHHPLRGAALPLQPGCVQQEAQTIHLGGAEGKTDERSDLPLQPGCVQQEAQTIHLGGAEGKTDERSDLPTQLADSRNTAVSEDRMDHQAAQREAARVAAKAMSSTDVVLRFDFMNSKDTRVSTPQERRMARTTVHFNKGSCCRPHPLLY